MCKVDHVLFQHHFSGLPPFLGVSVFWFGMFSLVGLVTVARQRDHNF